MINFVQDGNTIEFTASGNVQSGQLVKVGDALYGVAVAAVADGAKGQLSLSGVFSLPKKTKTDVIAAGDVIIDNSGLVKGTFDGDGDPLITAIVGKAVEASAATNDNVLVKLGL